MSLDSSEHQPEASVTKTELSGKDLLDGGVPMRNGRICDSQEGEADENEADENKGERTLADIPRTIHSVLY